MTMQKSTKSVKFSTAGPTFITNSMISMPSYALSDSLKERLWLDSEEIAAMIQNQDQESTAQVRGLSPKQYTHRHGFVQTILAQQEEQREELGGTDERGIRMMACALSKPDQKKALQLARLDAMEAHDIHRASACYTDSPLKSIEEYTRRTTFVPVRRRRAATARGA
ncbi:expressed unknown protein [Seminavis robusta]|uniref:Uncharacterized protein n=1 Tax=Seminavis robusta TaxID=568900 RepID=A0A9N8E406_9STRA|nr:expressed unknown protein [Seminavis robusta]|eukprot:Sro638_g179660.1 n/a (167) ;mRNA; r:47540-48040